MSRSCHASHNFDAYTMCLMAKPTGHEPRSEMIRCSTATATAAAAVLTTAACLVAVAWSVQTVHNVEAALWTGGVVATHPTSTAVVYAPRARARPVSKLPATFATAEFAAQSGGLPADFLSSSRARAGDKAFNAVATLVGSLMGCAALVWGWRQSHRRLRGAGVWEPLLGPRAGGFAMAAMAPEREGISASFGPVSDSEFSKSVVRVLTKQFGAEETERVVKAWRRMDTGVVHSETTGNHPLMVQRSSFHIEGLTGTPKPVWQNADITWATDVEDGWRKVRAELEQVLRKDAAELEATGSQGWVSPVEFGAGEAYGTEWKTLGLVERGRWEVANSQLFPETCRLLRQSEAPLMEAFFAKLPAGAKILPHSDGCNFVMTASLGVIVPERGCSLHVGDATCTWSEGEIFLFDSSFLHEARNDADEDRYALVMRVWHPELTPIEIQAISYVFDCIEQRFADEFQRQAQKPKSYFIEIEEQAWKIPGGTNVFDVSIFGDDVALFDVEDQTYAGFNESGKCLVEPGKKYARRHMRSEGRSAAT